MLYEVITQLGVRRNEEGDAEFSLERLSRPGVLRDPSRHDGRGGDAHPVGERRDPVRDGQVDPPCDVSYNFV